MVFGGFREILFFREVKEMIEFENDLRARLKPDESEKAWAETSKYIKVKIPDRKAFLKRLEDYAQNGKPVWYAGKNPCCDDLSDSQLIKSYMNLFRGIEYEKMLTNASWATHINYYAKKVLECRGMTLEMTVGAGLGIAAVASKMSDSDFLTCVDIDFKCAKNSDGILSYFGKRGVGIATSLWNLPFDDETFSTICSHFGIDECREIGTVLSEAVRFLKPGGRIVLASNESGYRRTRSYFDMYGIERPEAQNLLKLVRHYADKQQIDAIMSKHRLTETDYKSIGERYVAVYKKQAAE